MAHYRITQIEDYEPLVGAEVVQRIRDKAAKLKGPRIANFNSTYYGRRRGRDNFFAHAAHE
jgi:hypothetical protein